MTRARTPAPTDLRDFLKGQGWSLLEAALRDRLYVLENASYPRRQFIFPIDAQAPDYADSVESVLDKFAEIAGITKTSVMQKVGCVKDDVLRLRVFHDGNDAALPLAFAASFVSSTEKLIKSAASTVLRPRAHHPRLGFSEAAQLVEKSRFGQTERGSFIIRVECPIYAMEVQGSLTHQEDVPFVRQVTSTLQTALVQLISAIEEDQLDRLVEELKRSTSPIISSNLCEAVVGMHDESVDNSLDVEIDWSPLKPVASRVPQGCVRIQRDYFARIDEVQRELRSAETHHDDNFVGTVERLEGELGPDGRRSGPVMLSLLLPDEGETVRARVVLSADDYARADRAHMTNGAYVLVQGRLRPGRQPRQLTDVRRFEVLGDRTGASDE
jgi:hypothetical protein